MVKFGVQLWQEEFDFDGLKKAWCEVEDLGYDSAWLYDHFYPMSSQPADIFSNLGLFFPLWLLRRLGLGSAY